MRIADDRYAEGLQPSQGIGLHSRNRSYHTALTTLVKYYRRQKRPNIHIVRFYQPDGANADICRRKAIRQGAQIVEPGTEGTELVDALRPDGSPRLDTTALLEGKPRELGPGEWILYKPRWVAFYNTRLDNLLRRLEVSTVVVTGCNFPNCPPNHHLRSQRARLSHRTGPRCGSRFI